MGGDVIVAADGKPVSTIDELRDVIADHKPGDKIELKIYRGDTAQDRHRHARAATDLPLPVAARCRLPSWAGNRATRPPAPARRGLGALGADPRDRTRRVAVVIVRAVDDDETPERGSLLLDEELRRGRAALGGRRLRRLLGLVLRPHRPIPLPAAGCTFIAEYMTAAHLVLVWEERDDPNLLWHAQRAKEVGRNPRVVSYESSFGPERLVLRVGSSRPTGARRARQGLDTTVLCMTPVFMTPPIEE